MTHTDDCFQKQMKVAKEIVKHVVNKLKRDGVIVAVDIAVVNDHMTLTMQRNDGASFSDEEKDQIRKVMLSEECNKTVGSILSQFPFKWKKFRIRVCSREKGNQQYVWTLEKVKGKK